MVTESRVFVYHKVKAANENYIEKFDTDSFYCTIGDLTQDECNAICVEMKTVAIKFGFIDRGYYENNNPSGPVSSIGVIKMEDVSADNYARFIETNAAFQKKLESGNNLKEDDPYFLLQRASKIASLSREHRGCLGTKKGNHGEPTPAQMDKVLGTMVYVLMKICNLSKEEAANQIKSSTGFKSELLDYSFEPITEIDQFTDMINLPQGRADRTIEATRLLTAAVVAIQCCCKTRPMDKNGLKKAFGSRAYNNTRPLKESLGFPIGRK